ncbi:MAG: hypothetical protein JW811_09715 [Clostridiales bacterium]|nr:hypothetical protein [Clostridiales bacterium]
MKRTLMCALVVIALFAALCLTTAAASAEAGEQDPFAVLDSVSLIPESQLVSKDYEQSGDITLVTFEYRNATIQQVVALIESLFENRWYFVENQFRKGHTYTLDLAYSIEPGNLVLNLTVDGGAVEWPETMWPSVQCGVPAFPYGQYAGVDGDAPFMGSDSRCFLYDNVTEQEIRHYLETLDKAGFIRDEDYGWYSCWPYNVDIGLGDDGQVRINVGEDMPGPETSPPSWDVPVDTSFLVMLIDTAVTVHQEGNIWTVSARNMSLEDLYYFIYMAEFDWSPLDDQYRMELPDHSWQIQIAAFDSTEQTAEITFTCPTLEFTDYRYVVTSGSYLPENALSGVREEFGSAAQLADWDVISALYGDRFTAFMNAAGIQTDVDVWLERAGQEYDGRRHYFLARISAQRRNFALYDLIGDLAWLGTWYGIEMPALVKLPINGADTSDGNTDADNEDTDPYDSDYDTLGDEDTVTHPPLQVDDQFKYTRNFQETFHYKDNYFAEDSTIYNDSLSTMSLCLAMSAFAKPENDTGGFQPYADRSANVRDLLTKAGFSNIGTNHWFTVVPTLDSIGVAAGSKLVDYDGETYTLIAVAIRGGYYEKEWASNFTMGVNGEHSGFAYAKTQTLDYIRSYITDNQITGKVKLWIVGYSRAGATANLTAAAIDNGEVLSAGITLNHEDLFAYCFEPPAGGYSEDVSAQWNAQFHSAQYNNIFNIVNPADPVPKLAPAVLGFSRYGTDITLPSKSFDSQYESKRIAMLRFYYSLPSIIAGETSYSIDDFQVVSVLPEINLRSSITSAAGGAWGFLSGIGSGVMDVLSSGADAAGSLWNSYSGPLGDLYDEAAADAVTVGNWLSDGVSSMTDFVNNYTGGVVYNTINSINDAAYNAKLYAAETAIDGANAALNKAQDLADAAVADGNAVINYVFGNVPDNTNQDIFLDILISRIALENVETRSNYRLTWQDPLRAAVEVNSNWNDDSMDLFLSILKEKMALKTQQFFRIIYSDSGSTADLRNLVTPIVTESLREAGITSYSAVEIAVCTRLIIDLIADVIVENPLLILTVYENSGSLENAHTQEVCFAWLMSRDPNYTAPNDPSTGSGNADSGTTADLSAAVYNVSFYTDINQGGTCVVRSPGQYSFTHLNMGFPNDSLSCIRIGQRPDGHIKVVLYQNTYYNLEDEGTVLIFDQPGVYNLTNYNFNDECSSYEIFLFPND